MIQFLNWLYVGAAVLVLFGASIFVHELGHFLMARRRGLKVDGFSIGLGPKIFGWKRGGVDYAVRWIPAGGFVALPQMVTSEALEGKSQTTTPLPPASPGSKILVALAGPAMNAVFAFVIATAIYFLGLPVAVDPAVIGGVEPGSPEAKLGLRAGDRILAVDGRTVKSWEEVQTRAMLAPTNLVAVTLERDGIQTNYWLEAKVNEHIGLKLFNLDPKTHPTIGDILPDSAAEQAGLKRGDEVLVFAGVPVAGQQQLIDLIRERPGKACEVIVRRGDRKLQITATPRLDPATHRGLLGMNISSSPTTVYELQRPGPPPWVLVGSVCQQVFDTMQALAHSKRTGVKASDLSGPPGILMVLAAEVKTDLRLALKFMILLNISLAVLNLLPVPVLDGGHVLLAIIEKLRGRPLNARLQEYATTAFAAVLISFMLYVSFNDVFRRFGLFRSMLNQQVEIKASSGETNGVAR